MRVLVACEFSGTVRDAFKARGHDSWSCDVLPTDKPGNHIQDDVLLHLNDGWDLMIAHPPCTLLCNSGVRWLKDNAIRINQMVEACKFFRALLNCSIPKICIENPIPHKYARDIIGKYTQIIQPWQFGHGETKATCLWLHNLPKLVPTNIVEGREARIHKMGPSPDRWKKRSVTYQGIADGMAAAWG